MAFAASHSRACAELKIPDPVEGRLQAVCVSVSMLLEQFDSFNPWSTLAVILLDTGTQ